MTNTYTPDPDTQAMVAMILQLAGFGGGGGVTTPLGGLSYGYEPTAMQNINQYGMLPPVDEEGGSIEDMAKRANYMQDYSDLATDPFYAGGAGGGAFSADAFAPTVTYEVVPTPGTDMLNFYLAAPGTLEGQVAAGILQQGLTASEIVNMMQYTWANGSEEERNQLMTVLGPYAYPDQNTGELTINWGDVMSRVLPMEQDYLADPRPGMGGSVMDADGNVVSSGGNYVEGVDPTTGRPIVLREIVTESPLAEQFHEMGLPLPTDEYTPESLMSSEWQQGASLYEAGAPGLMAGVEAAHTASDSAAQRWLDAQTQAAAGTLQGGRQNQGEAGLMGTRSGVGTYQPTVDQPDQGPAMVGVVPAAGTVAVTPDIIASLETMSVDELQQFIDDHPNLPLDQREMVGDIVASAAASSYGTSLYGQWSNLGQQVSDWIKGATPPDDVTQAQMDAYNQALGTTGASQLVAPGGHYPQESLAGVMDLPDSDDPAVLQNWLMSSWGALTDDQRQSAVDEIQTRADEQYTLLAGSEDPPLIAQREQWRAVAEAAQGLLAAGSVAAWNLAQGGGAGESVFAGGMPKRPAGPGREPPPEPPPDFWNAPAPGPQPADVMAGIGVDANANPQQIAMQRLLAGGASGGTTPGMPTSAGYPQGMPPVGDTYLAKRQPTNAMMSSLMRAMTPWFAESNQLPRPVTNPSPLQSPPGPSNADMGTLMRSMAGPQVTPQAQGPPSIPQLPSWMTGGTTTPAAPASTTPFTPPVTAPTSAPQSEQPGRGVMADVDPRTMAMIASLFGQSQSNITNTQQMMANQNQAAASGGITSPQQMLAAQGGGGQFNAQQVAGQAAQGGAAQGGKPQRERTAPKITSRLQSQAAAATQQWLAEDRRIRQLHRQVYGGDYQRSRARAFYFQQRGITPYTQAVASRQGALANYGMGY